MGGTKNGETMIYVCMCISCVCIYVIYIDIRKGSGAPFAPLEPE